MSIDADDAGNDMFCQYMAIRIIAAILRSEREGALGEQVLNPGFQFRLCVLYVLGGRGGGFSTAADEVLESMNLRRNVVVSASSFLFVLDAVRHSDVAALVPERLVRNRMGNLRVVEPPIPVPGFSISMAWHDRAHNDRVQRWLRQQLLEHVAKGKV